MTTSIQVDAYIFDVTVFHSRIDHHYCFKRRSIVVVRVKKSLEMIHQNLDKNKTHHAYLFRKHGQVIRIRNTKIMDDGVTYAENELKPIIAERVDELARRAQNIAYSKLIDDKLAALRQAGEDLKSSVNEKVDRLIIQANEKQPDQDDPFYDEKVQIYRAWLDEVTQGVRNVHSFFNRIWTKFKELLDKVFRWIRDGVMDLGEKILNAFRIVKITLFR